MHLIDHYVNKGPVKGQKVISKENNVEKAPKIDV
jgi:hypothetical protein